MKLYNGFSPNGARVESFIKEKGVEIPTQEIDVLAGDTHKPDFLELNTLAEIPVLVFDDGSVLTETIAICRYLESLSPEHSLFGSDAISQARIEMWNRRIELRIFNVIGDVARHEFELFKDRGQVPEYAIFRRDELTKNLTWLDGAMSDGRPFLAGDRFSVADITGMATLLLMSMFGYQVSSDLRYFNKWVEAMNERSSFPRFPNS